MRARLLVAMALSVSAAQLVSAETVPLPTQRPATLDERFHIPEVAPAPSFVPLSLAPAPEFQAIPFPLPRPGPSACRLLLGEVAIYTALPPISGPGPCGATDVVRLEAIKMLGRPPISVNPPAILRCGLAQAVANWVRDDLAPGTAATLGASLTAIANFDSYSCRGRNRIPEAKLSEHGLANALDIRALRLSNGTVIEPTDAKVPRAFREAMRRSACDRFKTVLGPGSDGYHENHVHVDLAERRNGYRLCQWQLDASPDIAHVPLPAPRPVMADRKPR